MKVRYRRQFLKDLARLPATVRPRVEALAFEALPAAKALADVQPRPKRLRGVADCYRIRVGDYRIGFRAEVDGVVTLERVLHRREIYRRFP